MKILLISSNTAKSPYPVYPLGLSMVAAALKESGHEIRVFDVLQSSRKLDQVLKAALPHAVGISVRNIDNVNLMHEERYIEKVVQTVECVRKHSSAKIILGGPAFSILPERILKVSGADYGIVGEGETSFARLIKAGEAGRWPAKGTVIRPETWIEPQRIPSAMYDGDLMKSYLSNGSLASIQTKRGCPLKCVYCSYPALEGAQIRPREPGKVVEDIKRLKAEHNANHIFFTDSVFNDDSGSYINLLETMLRNNIKINWSAFFKPSGINAENVRIMKESGLRAAEIGSDAASDPALQGQRKGFRWDDIVIANDTFNDAGIATAHYFMFGGPGETEKTVKQGIVNIGSLECAAAFIFMGIRILPDTELFEIAKQEGIVSRDQDLLKPVYYISPEVGRDWLEKTLKQGFNPYKHVLFPPDILDDKLQLLHKLGHKGALWDLLAQPRHKRI